jgi:hypothetical protein
MKKHYIGDEVPETEVKAPSIEKDGLTVESLRVALHEMSVMADIEPRAHDVIVRVQDNMGTSQFLATAIENHSWLRQKAYKTERRGASVLYFLKMDK